MLKLKHNYLYPRLFYGHHLLAASFEHAFDFEAPFSKGKHYDSQNLEIYYTEKTSLKLNLFYLHCFMLSHALQRLSTSKRLHSNLALEGLFPKAWQFDTLLARFIERDNVFIYGTEFDSQVHEELKRQ